ncbi:MAG: flagellar motor protein MotB [Thermodesulfobacteriota bacterium]
MPGPNLESLEPRIVRKKKVSGGHHGGAWKVAYADFVTAMMALFIVLWIMSQSPSIRMAVAEYFRNPGLLPATTGLLQKSDMGGEIPTPGHPQEELQPPTPVKPDISQEKSFMEELKRHIQKLIADLPELEKIKDQVEFEVTDDGLRIELLDKENSNFFDIGSANLKPETKKILGIIAKELGRVPNPLTIEGHTDARPYGGKSYTNWELSADRANAARRLMDSEGLRPEQVLSVRGFADRELRNRQDPNDFQNRRVSIIVNFADRNTNLPLDLPHLQGKVTTDPKELKSPAKKSRDKPLKTPASSATPTSPAPPAPPAPVVSKLPEAPTQAAKPPPAILPPEADQLPGPIGEELKQALKLLPPTPSLFPSPPKP